GGYVGFEETEALRPHSQICLLSLENGESKVIHDEKRWIGHVNASPTQPHLISFCHEGPWEKVDHRIWVMNLETQQAWKIREGAANQFAGHEYWHADGLHIGYHGFTDNLEKKEGKFLGFVRYDNTEREEFEFPYQNMHIHSNNSNLIVGDGQQANAYHGERYQDCIFLWKKSAEGMEGPRILCKHRGSFHIQKIHVHPRFSPDGKQVLFTSDMSGYGNLHMVDVPPFESLPSIKDGKLYRTE
ncbi:MAG: Oligogalacturonide lyase, partial [Bacilli bacterium]|nr:Oligogalacturonide lyase [Bacilli bacterium]